MHIIIQLLIKGEKLRLQRPPSGSTLQMIYELNHQNNY